MAWTSLPVAGGKGIKDHEGFMSTTRELMKEVRHAPHLPFPLEDDLDDFLEE